MELVSYFSFHEFVFESIDLLLASTRNATRSEGNPKECLVQELIFF